jgi:hypothetical protein
VAAVLLSYDLNLIQCHTKVSHFVSASVDTGVAIYTRYFADVPVQTAYAAHFAGALAG